MTDINTLSKEAIVELVDSYGELEFTSWYKNELEYTNGGYTVSISPEYRHRCHRIETLESLLRHEDYDSVFVYKGREKPWEWYWYKEGGEI